MRILIHICYLLLELRRYLVNSEEIFVGLNADNYPCSDCSRFSSLLEGLQSGFLSTKNTTITLIDDETHLRSDVFSKYFEGNPSKPLHYTSQSGADFKKILVKGSKTEGSNLSKIIFYDQYFSLNFANVELHLENIQFSFSTQNETYVRCLFCLEENEEEHPTAILFLDNVAFECIKGSFIYLAPKDFSIIDSKGSSFEIKL